MKNHNICDRFTFCQFTSESYSWLFPTVMKSPFLIKKSFKCGVGQASLQQRKLTARYSSRDSRSLTRNQITNWQHTGHSSFNRALSLAAILECSEVTLDWLISGQSNKHWRETWLVVLMVSVSGGNEVTSAKSSFLCDIFTPQSTSPSRNGGSCHVLKYSQFS